MLYILYIYIIDMGSLLRAILSYQRDPYVHPLWSLGLGRSDTDSSSPEQLGLEVRVNGR